MNYSYIEPPCEYKLIRVRLNGGRLNKRIRTKNQVNVSGHKALMHDHSDGSIKHKSMTASKPNTYCYSSLYRYQQIHSILADKQKRNNISQIIAHHPIVRVQTHEQYQRYTQQKYALYRPFTNNDKTCTINTGDLLNLKISVGKSRLYNSLNKSANNLSLPSLHYKQKHQCKIRLESIYNSRQQIKADYFFENTKLEPWMD